MAGSSFRSAVRKMQPVLVELLQRRMKQLTESTDGYELRGRLAEFTDVIIPDGCAFKLASVLSGVYPGTGNPSELKLHAVYSVKTGMASTTAAAGRRARQRRLLAGVGARRTLHLGPRLQRHDSLHRRRCAGASAPQSTGNPKVLARYDADGTRHTEDMPMPLNRGCELYAPPTGRETARVVCVPYEGEDRYYLTTLPRDIFTPSDCAELYRVRWEVEHFFRNWHGALRMDDRLFEPRDPCGTRTARS